jgi:leucyl-tRNA synthetase
MNKYNPAEIEHKWQELWVTNKIFVAQENEDKEKKFILVEFPFPSGDGLHMGHLRSYTAADVVARYYRMQGKEVMYPIGWDAFGLPAENYAIKHGKKPADTTASNIANIKRQCQMLGYSFDWLREINTTDPNYYKWTQWIFLQFYKAGLAYEATGLINWCPVDKTGLANEEVINGACERCGAKVEKKELRQWYLKITAYAEKLLQGLEELPEWPEAVKSQQANWIGKSEGAEIDFEIAGNSAEKIKVFTTRPDTIFGATYLVVAPEHGLIEKLQSSITNFEEVDAYAKAAQSKEELDRTAEGKEKTGVELEGVRAINPATKEEIPVWVADYVLGNYGTGAIMAVPAHDERDGEFAEKFGLPIVELKEFADGSKFGTPKTTYKLRDWVFSRQRYWGEPIPLVHCAKDGIVPVPEDQLPVILPEVENYEPTGTGESPLAAIDEWVNTTCPECGGPAKRETNTMPQWAGSSWYYIRYADPQNEKEIASKDAMKYWLPVDIYFGGMEHTTLHLLYSRFWNIFLCDQGIVPVSEPYTKRVPHGLILAEDGSKMSKSKGNVINPDELVKAHGADTVRMYELFLGPHEAAVAWSDQGMVGVARFLDRVWYWIHNAERSEADSEEVTRELNATIKKVTEDIEGFRFNTVVSSLMSFHNAIKDKPVSVETIQAFLKLLYPVVPHIAEEMNEIVIKAAGSVGTSLQFEPWPSFDESILQEEIANIVVQVNGKVKETIEMPIGASEEEVKAQALAINKVQAILNGAEPKRIIFVQNKVINIVQ